VRDDLEILTDGMAALNLDAPPGVPEKLLAYRDLLMKWNRVYNLTAIKDPKEVLVSHLLDSLAILPWAGEAGRLLDVGSGGGLPGIPLAIARPSLAVTLVESAGKKSAFQRQAVIELGLRQVESWRGRVEDFSVPEEGKFDRIVSRAFADLALFVALTRHLIGREGYWLAMKGKKPEAEIAALPPDVQLETVIPLEVPGLSATRHLLILRPAA
jgi:16S rRNA (guanine527-N7)-methyltransferase